MIYMMDMDKYLYENNGSLEFNGKRRSKWK